MEAPVPVRVDTLAPGSRPCVRPGLPPKPVVSKGVGIPRVGEGWICECREDLDSYPSGFAEGRKYQLILSK